MKFFDAKEFDLDKLPAGYALDYVCCHFARPNRMLLGTLPVEYWKAAFEKADAHRKTTDISFTLPVVFKLK